MNHKEVKEINKIQINIKRARKNQDKDHIVAQITATKVTLTKEKEVGVMINWQKK